MFKFGRPYIDVDSIIHDFVQNHFVTGQTFVSGMTMNYMIAVDPAVPFNPQPGSVERYATKIVNPNFYGTITDRIRWDDEL